MCTLLEMTSLDICYSQDEVIFVYYRQQPNKFRSIRGPISRNISSENFLYHKIRESNPLPIDTQPSEYSIQIFIKLVPEHKQEELRVDRKHSPRLGNLQPYVSCCILYSFVTYFSYDSPVINIIVAVNFGD